MATTAINTKFKYNYQAPYSCDVGDVLRLFANFTDIDSVALDPGSLQVFVKDPDGIIAMYAYPGNIIKTSVGSYYLDINVTKVGTWFYRWESSGQGQCAAERTFSARQSYFPPPIIPSLPLPEPGVDVSVFHYDTSEVSYTGAPNLTGLKSLPIPAGTIIANKLLHIIATGRFAANAQTKTVRLSFGAIEPAELEDSIGNNNGGWLADIKLTYRSETEILALIDFSFFNSSGVVVKDFHFPAILAAPVIDFAVSAESPTNGNITQQQLVAYLHN